MFVVHVQLIVEIYWPTVDRCVARCVFQLFTLTKVWVYRVVSIVLGIPLAILWGFTFAWLAFCNNWCCMPGTWMLKNPGIVTSQMIQRY